MSVCLSSSSAGPPCFFTLQEVRREGNPGGERLRSDRATGEWEERTDRDVGGRACGHMATGSMAKGLLVPRGGCVWVPSTWPQVAQILGLMVVTEGPGRDLRSQVLGSFPGQAGDPRLQNMLGLRSPEGLNETPGAPANVPRGAGTAGCTVRGEERQAGQGGHRTWETRCYCWREGQARGNKEWQSQTGVRSGGLSQWVTSQRLLCQTTVLNRLLRDPRQKSLHSTGLARGSWWIIYKPTQSMAICGEERIHPTLLGLHASEGGGPHLWVMVTTGGRGCCLTIQPWSGRGLIPRDGEKQAARSLPLPRPKHLLAHWAEQAEMQVHLHVIYICILGPPTLSLQVLQGVWDTGYPWSLPRGLLGTLEDWWDPQNEAGTPRNED